MREKRRPTALGAWIFAGCFTLGMQTKFEILAHLEESDYGVATVKKNFPRLPVYIGGPNEWPLKDFAGVDVVYGNPPCAAWSQAGHMTYRGTANHRVLHDGGPNAPVIFGCCPFLGLDNRCSIYEDRPAVCRTFGSEISPLMTCSYQARDGHVRSRPERRRIEREIFDYRESALRRMGASKEDRAALNGRLGIKKS